MPSSSSGSLNVPGVTTRVTSRRTSPLACAGVLDLVADRDLEAGTHQLAEVALERLMRHAAHRRFVFGAALARGERDLENGRRLRRVLVEHLEEVTHAIEQDRVRVLRLHLEVVAQHRCELLAHPGWAGGGAVPDMGGREYSRGA